MKKILLLFCLVAIGLTSYAQNEITVAEPDFTGECLLIVGGDGVLLDKEFCQVKTKANIGLAMVGYSKAKSEIKVKTPAAQARTVAGPIKLIVRATDNNSDPLAVVKLFKFKQGKKDRKSELSSYDMFGGLSENNQSYLKFSGKKYGESSYLISIPNIEAGEYGIIVTNPNAKDEKSVVINCFGIDG